MAGLFQQFQTALQQQQSSQSAQAGGKKHRPVRKPVRAAAKPKAKPKRLVNKRALHNKLMKQLGGFFEDIANFTNDSSDDKTMTKEEKAKYTNNPPSAHSMAQPSSKEQLTVNDMVNAFPIPKAKGGARRYKKVVPKKAVPKKAAPERRPVVRNYRFSGGYEEDDDMEEFEEMSQGASGTATSMIPVSTGGRMHRRAPVRRAPVRRVPVRRARSPSSATRRPRPRVRRA
jgi:hypothetical protein